MGRISYSRQKQVPSVAGRERERPLAWHRWSTGLVPVGVNSPYTLCIDIRV